MATSVPSTDGTTHPSGCSSRAPHAVRVQRGVVLEAAHAGPRHTLSGSFASHADRRRSPQLLDQPTSPDASRHSVIASSCLIQVDKFRAEASTFKIKKTKRKPRGFDRRQLQAAPVAHVINHGRIHKELDIADPNLPSEVRGVGPINQARIGHRLHTWWIVG